jgi:hypothetical protein
LSRPQIDIIIDFLTAIGLTVVLKPINGTQFLPGLRLESGKLVIDTEKLLYRGDILHEAGHLATMPPEIRETMDNTLPTNDLHMGGEMMAIAWSYAVCVHLGLGPDVVFHTAGYKGGGGYIIENSTAGRYIGVPLLQWAGMAYEEKNAAQFNVKPYPHMMKWLRGTAA